MVGEHLDDFATDVFYEGDYSTDGRGISRWKSLVGCRIESGEEAVSGALVTVR